MTKVLVLRNCKSDMTSHNGFKWPETGHVEAPDWDPKPECGNGLHGLLWGEGVGSLLYKGEGTKWLVLEVDEEGIINLDGKVKFKECDIKFCGSQFDATKYLYDNGGYGRAIVGITLTCGDNSTVIGGDYSKVTGGHHSRVIGGHYSTVVGGEISTVTGGHGSTITGADYSTITGGNYSTVTGLYGSTVVGGYYSKVTGGDCSTVVGGNYSKVTGGNGSIISISYYDCSRARIKLGYVGEDGIEAGVEYTLYNECEQPRGLAPGHLCP